MDADVPAGGDERTTRLAQVEAMRARGEDPYPVRFDRTHTLTEVREHWGESVETGTTSPPSRVAPCHTAKESVELPVMTATRSPGVVT